MTLSRFLAGWVGLCVGAATLVAQTNPTVKQAMPTQTAVSGGAALSLDLRNYFHLPDVTGQVVQIDTVLGKMNFEMFAGDAPATVANFLRYVDDGRYTNTIIHRAIPGFVIQGGGYYQKLPLEHIPTYSTIVNEFKRSNLRGTIAMAKVGGNPDSAASEWFINLANNSANLDTQNNGFTVFARVIGNGMLIADFISNQPRSSDDFPLYNYTSGLVQAANLLLVRSVKRIPIYPDAATVGVLAFTAQTSNAAVAQVSVSGSTLTVTPGATAGTATITVRAADATTGQVTSTFDVNVAPGLLPPSIVRHPTGQTVMVGSSVAFSVEATGSSLSYQWRRDGLSLAGETGPTLLLKNVGPSNAAAYSVVVSNSANSVASTDATLTVTSTASAGRLINLSVLSVAGVGEQTLVAGFSVNGPGTSNLVIRGIGPTLTGFGVPGVLADPQLTLYDFLQQPLASNDNWSGADGRAVGGFELPAGSKDSVLSTSLAQGGFTAQVTGSGGNSGRALVEIYEAPPVSLNTQLVNLSARTQLNPGDTLTVGFTVGGSTARTVLIRAIGPGLTQFGLSGVMVDPKVVLVGSGQMTLGQNEDWGGGNLLVATQASVGAFSLQSLSSKDAMVIATLPPGGYTALVSGSDGGGGVVLVELYLLP